MRQELDQLKVRLEREQEQCKNMIATEKSRWKKVHFRGGVKPNRTNFELIFLEFFELKFKGPCKSFGYWGMKLLPGIRVIAKGLDLRPKPES